MRDNRKGVALVVVLGVLLIVVILANVILAIILSQSRLTHHQVSRSQAYYASYAGMNYAFEKLRTGAWKVNGPNDCTPVTTPPCTFTLHDDEFPSSIVGKQVKIVLIPANTGTCINPPGGSTCINITATYTYTGSTP